MLNFQRKVFGSQGLWKYLNFGNKGRRKLLAVFLCLSMLAAFFPGFSSKAEQEEKFSKIVDFSSITLHYAGADDLPQEPAIENGTLLKKDQQLVLRYNYEITEEQCGKILPDTRYYLEVSPHLILPDLGAVGKELTVETGDGPKKFGAICADGSSAWVVFDKKEDGSGTVLSEYGQLQDAFFYLHCGRAGEPPEGENPIEGKSNLYAMKFENEETLNFGYAEHEPVEARAQVQKSGALSGKTITWTIQYTPWQNPSGGITGDTNFELRDVIDPSLHSYAENSAKINGEACTVYRSREDIDGTEKAYVLTEASEEGGPVTLSFGGSIFRAGTATQVHPAQAVTITYETAIKDELLLPGGKGGQKVTNGVEVFAETDGGFQGLNICSSQTVAIPQPVWLTKKGTTKRHDDGTGSTTDWTVTFSPNGFSFTEENELTLHDTLPAGSILVDGSVAINGNPASAVTDAENGFTVSPISTENQEVTITYQTSVPEEMYDSGTSLGNNVAWFTFHYNQTAYETLKATTPVGSGDGSGLPGTATLVKANGGYKASTRTIDWTVTINPHKAYLKGGTFTDNLSQVGGACSEAGHQSGLELAGDKDQISILINGREPAEDEKNLVNLEYDAQVLTVTVGEVGAKTITIAYSTKVCDPCIFANNTAKKQFKNRIYTEDMRIGKNSEILRSAEAESVANVSAGVLAKKAPVYDYMSGKMKWTVEVDAAGLPMKEVTLTDVLPEGLKYTEDSVKTEPSVPGVSAEQTGQELTIYLESVSQKTAVTFDTEVDPEKIGFSSNEPVRVSNTIVMKGKADNISFAGVSSSASGSFLNHGLVKSSSVDSQKELIQYEVLINPYGLALSEYPSLVDTLDKRLQADLDTLRFYKASLSGTTGNSGQKPGYTKEGEGLALKAQNYDLESNSFTVQLPIEEGSRDAYVLTYTADIMKRQTDGYSNSVRFEGGAVLLGGSKNNSAAVGGGGGGGGGVAARKAVITVMKKDCDNQNPLAGVEFTLYQWDSENHVRGLPVAQAATDAQGKASFLVKPEKVYELEETESLPGYESEIGWVELPDGVAETGQGLLVTAGAAKSELELQLTNEAHKADIEYRLVNELGVPLAGTTVELFLSDPTGEPEPIPDQKVTAAPDGTIRFLELRRGAVYFLRQPGGEILKIEIPLDTSEPPRINLPDGSSRPITGEDSITGEAPEEKQWVMTVHKVASGSEEPLAGAAFELYAEEECRTLIQRGVSGAEGEISFPGLMIGNEYWLKETEAPSGYQIALSIYKVSEEAPDMKVSNEPEVPPENPDETEKPENPGETEKPENPGETEKPENPGETEKPENPDETEKPENPDETEGPENPGDTEKPEAPGETEKPENPSGTEKPENPGAPGQPEEPGNSGISGTPENPGDSGRPEEPGNSGTPGISEYENPGSFQRPVNSEIPENPEDSRQTAFTDDLELPNNSGTAGNQEESKQPAISGIADTPDAAKEPGKDADAPKTRDHTVWLEAVVLLSGTILTVMTLYYIWREKKRERK